MSTLYARNANVWKTAIGAFAKSAGVWKDAVVWAKSSNAWSIIAGAMTSASAGRVIGAGNPSCTYFTTGGSCVASAYVEAYPVGGFGPYTYSWTVVDNPGGASVTNLTSKQCYISATVRKGFSKDVTVNCTVTDSSGVSKTTNNVTVTLTGEDGSSQL